MASTELDRRVASDGLVKVLGSYAGNFARIIPAHVNVDTFVGLAAAQVTRDARLFEAAKVNPESLISALRECAAKGHVPEKGTFALVPYNNHRAKGGREVVGIEEVRGVIQRFYRGGGVVAVHAAVVREHDPFTGPPRVGAMPTRHVVDPFASPEQRGPLVGVYAWADMHTGVPSHVVWLNRHDIVKYRNSSRSGDAFWGPAWPGEGPWTADMWQKTALHRLEKWVVTSAAYRWEVARAGAAAEQPMDGVPPRPAHPEMPEPPDVVDAEVVDPESGDEAWPQAAQPAGGPS